jgi:dienelactone hydrolase
MPTPAWQTGTYLSPPQGDATVSLLEQVRPGWLSKLSNLDGWPIRPTMVIPLSRKATSVDPASIVLYANSGAGPVEREMDFHASLEDEGKTLLIKPVGPLPSDAREVILVIREGGVGGASALAVCGPDGKEHPGYAAARESLPTLEGVELALPFRLATTHQDLEFLWERISATPVLSVDSVEARTLDSFGDRSPPPEVAAHLNATAASGILSLPDYRDANGEIQRDPGGGPKVAGRTLPGFVLALPAQGTAPFPFVLFQHGGGQDKADFLLHAGPLAEAGFAVIGIDLPFHGDRAAAGGGGDLDILDFDNLLRTRDNLRQASADHQAVLTGIDALNEALESVWGAGPVLDPEHGFYMGLSMGGISGSLTFGVARDLDAAALFVGAAGYPEIVQFGFFSLMVSDILELEPLEREVVLGLAEILLDGADPYAYAMRSEDRSQRPRPVLFFQALGELIIDPPTSDAWARAFGADLAVPFDHAVSGMQETSLPAADNFTWPNGQESATRLLVQCPMNEVSAGERHGGLIVQDYTQQMVAHCFRRLLDTGSCELIDTGYFQR